MVTRPCPREILERLAKAVDEHDKLLGRSTTGHYQDSELGRAYQRVHQALDAVRSATAPLRTREEVDREIVEKVRRGAPCGRISPIEWSDLCDLCREPTSGPGDENTASPPCAPLGATYYTCRNCGARGAQCSSKARHGGHIVQCENVTGHLGRHTSDRLYWSTEEALPDSGPGSASATKESSDTAGAPAGAAKAGDMPAWECDVCCQHNRSVSRRCMRCGHLNAEVPEPDPADRDCNCDQAVELARVVRECRRLAQEIVVATEGLSG